MENELQSLGSQSMTFADIQKRKEEVLFQIKKQQNKIKQCVNGLTIDYRQPESLISLQGIKKVTGVVSITLYMYRLFRSVTRVTGFLRKK